ncbi:hypothetical protein Pfo_018744 [Paulownia fortunei]|nr:hypothetical protein Pfo_018744 [Paulownia fortunei]
MAMTSLISLISSNSIVLIIALFFLISPSYCSNLKHSPDTFRGLVVEEKARLGSTPPSCHNKCNQCHPCMAVQVPTMPRHHQETPLHYSDSSPGNTYSNYKPLGWKCRCGGNFFNP